jgi:hypothetical protein
MDKMERKTIDDFNKEEDEFQKYYYIAINKRTFKAFPFLQVRYTIIESWEIYKINDLNNMSDDLYELETHYIKLNVFRYFTNTIYDNVTNLLDGVRRNNCDLELLKNIKYRDDIDK